MKTNNMTFSEALEAMKQGYKVRRECWNNCKYLFIDEEYFITNSDNDLIDKIRVDLILATDWEIYNEPKPEPQFEIGELVMMRDGCYDIWRPRHFARKNESRKPFETMNGSYHMECAKFDKDIVFTNKPAKL